jgi:hypothetical protein
VAWIRADRELWRKREPGGWERESTPVHGSRGGPAGEWWQSRLHHWLEQKEIQNNRERGILEVKRARASYMVAEVGQQENGNRADSTTGENKRGQRTMEKEGAWRLREGEHRTW